MKQLPSTLKLTLTVILSVLFAFPGIVSVDSARAEDQSTDEANEKVETKSAPAKQANTGGGPWGHPDVLKAAAAIQMNPEQLTVFRASVGQFVDGLMKETMRLVKRQEPDIPRKLRRKRNKLAKQLDKQMAGVLDEEQYTRYETYRTLLMTKLKQMGSGGGRRRR